MKKWENALLPNLAMFMADVKEYRLKLSLGDANLGQTDAEKNFRDILKIATKHFYRTSGDLAKKADVSAGALSSWTSGRLFPTSEIQRTLLDVITDDIQEHLDERKSYSPDNSFTVLDELIDRLNTSTLSTRLANIRQAETLTLSETFAAARNGYLQSLSKGIDKILTEQSEISSQDFHMVLSAAQANLYADMATKQLAGKFNTTTQNYKSWEKGESAPRHNGTRQDILKAINTDIALQLAQA